MTIGLVLADISLPGNPSNPHLTLGKLWGSYYCHTKYKLWCAQTVIHATQTVTYATQTVTYDLMSDKYITLWIFEN